MYSHSLPTHSPIRARVASIAHADYGMRDLRAEMQDDYSNSIRYNEEHSRYDYPATSYPQSPTTYVSAGRFAMRHPPPLQTTSLGNQADDDSYGSQTSASEHGQPNWSGFQYAAHHDGTHQGDPSSYYPSSPSSHASPITPSHQESSPAMAAMPFPFQHQPVPVHQHQHGHHQHSLSQSSIPSQQSVYSPIEMHSRSHSHSPPMNRMTAESTLMSAFEPQEPFQSQQQGDFYSRPQ